LDFSYEGGCDGWGILHIWSGAKEHYIQCDGGKPEGKEALGRPRSKYKSVIKRDYVEMGLEYLD
jgi:hypothetical protein